jgi:integrase
VDLSTGLLILRDPKGRRTQPRIHELPISTPAMTILAGLMDRAATLESNVVFTSDGRKPVDHGTLTVAVTAISAAMIDAKESAESFTLRDLRRTTENLARKNGGVARAPRTDSVSWAGRRPATAL